MKRMIFRIATLSLLAAFASLHSIADERDLKKVATELYGADFRKPSEESLIGRYIHDTGAQTVVRRFLTAPAGSQMPASKLGPEKLVVAVSPTTLDTFLKYFSGEQFLYHVHIPYAGSLGYAYKTTDKSNLSYPQGSLYIPILLSPTESKRTALSLGPRQQPKDRFDQSFVPGRYAAHLIVDKDGQSYTSGAINGWNGCTAWFGDLPIGEKLVTQYEYPAGPQDPNGTKPNVGKLRPANLYKTGPTRTIETKQLVTQKVFKPNWWNKKKGHYVTEQVWQTVKTVDPNSYEMRTVDETDQQLWTYPGHEMLGDMLGQREARLRGEFANTGWLAYTLLGSVAVDRVPVVFLIVTDHTQPIRADFDTQINAH